MRLRLDFSSSCRKCVSIAGRTRTRTVAFSHLKSSAVPGARTIEYDISGQTIARIWGGQSGNIAALKEEFQRWRRELRFELDVAGVRICHVRAALFPEI